MQRASSSSSSLRAGATRFLAPRLLGFPPGSPSSRLPALPSAKPQHFRVTFGAALPSKGHTRSPMRRRPHDRAHRNSQGKAPGICEGARGEPRRTHLRSRFRVRGALLGPGSGRAIRERRDSSRAGFPAGDEPGALDPSGGGAGGLPLRPVPSRVQRQDVFPGRRLLLRELLLLAEQRRGRGLGPAPRRSCGAPSRRLIPRRVA